MYEGRAQTGIEGTGGGTVGPLTGDVDVGDAAASGLSAGSDLGRPGRADSLLKPNESRRDVFFTGDGGGGVLSSTGALSGVKRGSALDRPVGDDGALATAAVRPSSCMSVLPMISGVELILLGLKRSMLPDSSEPVRVPSSDSASEGPARGEERSGRGSRRGGAVMGAGARYAVWRREMGGCWRTGAGVLESAVAARREAGTSGNMLLGI